MAHGPDFNERGCADLRRLMAPRVTRRTALAAGGLSALGLGLPRLLAARELAGESAGSALPGFGKAKACIFLFMWGGPSQLDTFDPKPDAPREIRGPFSRSRPACRACKSANTSRGWPA